MGFTDFAMKWLHGGRETKMGFTDFARYGIHGEHIEGPCRLLIFLTIDENAKKLRCARVIIGLVSRIIIAMTPPSNSRKVGK